MRIARTAGVWLLGLMVLEMVSGCGATVRLHPKDRPPPASVQRGFSFPRTTTVKLENGLELVIYEKRTLPVLYLQLWIRSGKLHEPSNRIGLPGVVASMLTEGTTTRTSRQIAEETEFIGAGLNASDGTDVFRVTASGLSRDFAKILELFADVTLRPSFPADELKKKQAEMLSVLRYQQSQPKYHANRLAYRLVYGPMHPYGRVYETRQDILAITRADLVRFHKQHLIPNNAVLVIAGDVDTQRTIEAVKRKFGAWKMRAITAVERVATPKACGRRIHLVDRPTSVQSYIFVGRDGISNSDPRRFDGSLMNQILGGGATGRLFINLREKRDLTYGVYSTLSGHRYGGDFVITTNVANKDTGAALREIFAEMRTISSAPVKPSELDDAKNYLIGRFPLMLATPGEIARRIAYQRVFKLPSDYWQSYPGRVRAVTAEGILRIARAVVTPKDAHVVVVGKRSDVEQQLRKFGPLTIIDLSGKVVKRDPGSSGCKR